MKLKFCEIKRATTILLVVLSVVGCQKHKLTSDDVEYRQNEEGKLILYEIGEDEPFEGIIVDEYANGHTNCKIEFKDGLRDGNFTFWRENEIPLSKGEYSKGRAKAGIATERERATYFNEIKDRH
jgi:antitoxin component YwqK of YwqJK toxin-antitoxin module